MNTKFPQKYWNYATLFRISKLVKSGNTCHAQFSVKIKTKFTKSEIRKSFRIRKMSQVPVQGRIRCQSLFLFLTPKHEKWESTRLRIEHDTFHRFQLPPKQPSKSRPLQLKQSKPHVQYQPRLQSIRIGERQWLRRCWWDMKWRLHPMFRRGLVQRPESAIATKAGLWTPAIQGEKFCIVYLSISLAFQ